MSSQIAFGLERAAWPALLVDERGTILRANAAAASAFGTIVSGDAPMLSAVWSPENGVPALDFLRHWEQSPMPVVMLKFRSSSGGAMNYTTSISTFTKDNHKWFVLQLVLASVPPPTATLSSPPAAATATAAPAVTTPAPKISAEENKIIPTDASALILKQKLDCALQLARTVSLDFNNALTSILGHASFLLSKAEPGHPWRNSLLEIEKSASLAAEITNELAIFSRQEKESRRAPPGSLNMVIGRCVDFFRNAHAEKISWNLQLDKELFAARFDEAKIQQALTKILENSVEAISSRGQIFLQTRNIELSEPTHDGNLRLAAGNYVCAEIADSGGGIAAEILPRVFEPFFTTKTNHRGLGLALVYGILTNHGGGVAVSNSTSGASVRIYLRAEKQLAQDHTGVSTDDLHGAETVLVVDDEDFLLTMAETILTEYGYHVLTANGGAKALALLSREEGKIELVVTDLVMPGMGGRELIERIGQIAPGTKILCVSGCVPPAEQQIGTAYLRKPFTSGELLAKVKRTIGASPALTAK